MTGPAEIVIDGEDRGCGELLIRLHTQLADVPAGTTVRLVTTDPGSAVDVPAWCRLTGHRYLGAAVTADGRGAHDFVLTTRRAS